MPQLKRALDNSRMVGPSQAAEIEHEPISGSKKTLNGLGYMRFLDTSTAAAAVASGATIAAYNNSGSVGFVAASDSPAMAVPSAAGANSWPLPPNQYTVLCVGHLAFVRPSANVFLYLVDDHSNLVNI